MSDPAADRTAPAPRVRHIEIARSARYLLAGGEGPVLEIWVVLHGYSMLASEMLRWFAPAATPARLLVVPEALNRYYTNHKTRKVGATWMTSEDREAEIRDYVRYLDAVLATVRDATGGSPRVEIHGFSQGATTAARWVGLGEARPARLVLWGGGLPHDMDLAAAATRLNAADLTLVIGDRDQYVDEARIDDESARMHGAGIRFTLRRFRGGHVVPWPELAALAGAAPDATSPAAPPSHE